MINILFIVGKTRSGKDTIAKELEKMHIMKPIVSYTTRPKRDNETNGVEHWFITKEEMEVIKTTQSMIAYTINEKTGIEYCATIQSLSPDQDYTYIINPDGIKWFLSKFNVFDDLFFKVLYVDCPENVIKERGQERNDDPEVFNKRLDSEREEFDDFRDNWGSTIDYFIDTTTYSKSDVSIIAQEIYARFFIDVNWYKHHVVKKAPIVPKFKVGDKVFTKYSESVDTDFAKLYPDGSEETIETVIVKNNMLNEAYYVTDKHPNIALRNVDIICKTT